jgi:hypothetical protein
VSVKLFYTVTILYRQYIQIILMFILGKKTHNCSMKHIPLEIREAVYKTVNPQNPQTLMTNPTQPHQKLVNLLQQISEIEKC